jgi:poly-gamma-glutamate capsule biosynthesis protein CapA/YwtB (metallophosphatase superfamily)
VAGLRRAPVQGSSIADAPRHLAAPPTPARRRTTLLALGAVTVLGLSVGYAAGRPDDDSTSISGTGREAPASRPSDRATTTSTDGTTTTSADGLGSGEPITIAFAGDMNFEGSNRARLDADPATAVGPYADVLRGADLAIGNLETSIAVGGTRADKQFAFRAPPSAVDALRAAGFDAVSMANNHGLDYGDDGLQESLAVARAQPDHFIIGIGGDDEEAFEPFTAVVKGQRVAVIGATQVLDSSLIGAWTATADQGGLASAKRVDRLVAEVEAARATSDTVVVFLHWGVEKMTCPTQDQQGLAQTLVAAGADLVIGSHAHRLQGGGRLGGAVVHYGLGNFLFKENSAEGARTGVFEVTVTGRRVDSYRWVPGRISNSVPAPLAGEEAASELSYWDGLRGCAGLAP